MARYPAPGAVKTRLARTLGPEAACALHRAFLLDLADRLRGVQYPVTWAFHPPEADFARLVPGSRCRAQAGADLGERMANAIAAEFAEGAGAVVVIGVDAPHLALDTLVEAAGALAGGADVVLGPARDGGYYLIGLAAPAPELFAGIVWGGADVLAATRASALAAGLAVHLLPADFDVDVAADLEDLRGLIARGEVALPRTAAFLAGLAAERS
ncbi:MAG TPA: TIGR04282 family arsenosugar biosynthesis glycosyltransferase [Candidatus Binatia bacterium]|nr:TIGR04282 family arsenosugar biosynthesis glycosyltransferase [Candidatus Binatia bacterium]